MNFLSALWQFARPHTIVGTTLSVTGLFVVAMAHANSGIVLWQEWLVTLVSCLGANVYIVGLNQLTDIEIDRINKPDLPLASGAMSERTGWSVILTCLFISLLGAYVGGYYLLLTVLISLFIGTVYSLPPIRLKRFHFWAAACIFTVRGVIVNLFLFLHFHFLYSSNSIIPLHVWILTAFVFGLSLVIAWFKDIPDMEGDSQFRIITLSLRLGARRVFQLGLGLLTICYLGMALAGVFGLPGVNDIVLIISHLALLAFAWIVGRKVDPTDQQTITRFYLFIWVLFFAEYLIFPLACVME